MITINQINDKVSGDQSDQNKMITVNQNNDKVAMYPNGETINTR